MKISLVTPSYNHGEFIARTIDSVLAQTGDFELEYVVLDGASSDQTHEILSSYADRLTWKSQPDDGQIDAINKGLSSATGDIVGWLNSDDVLLPGALQRVADIFRRNSNCQWLHGDCKVIDREDREIRKWISAYKRYHALRYSRSRLLTRNFISQMTVFWRRELMGQVGYLDPSLKLAFDYDYWLRLSAVCPPEYTRARLAAFRWYDSSKSGANYRAQFAEDALIARKNGATGLQARFAKRLHNWLTVVAYRSLAGLRSFQRNST